MSSFRRLAVPALASLLVLAACGGSDDGASVAESGDATSAASTPAATAPATSGAATAVPAALQFTAPAVGGGEIDASVYAGTPTVFWFWAPT